MVFWQPRYILTSGRSGKSNKKLSPQGGNCLGEFERSALAQVDPVVSGLGEIEKRREEENGEFTIVLRYLRETKCNR